MGTAMSTHTYRFLIDVALVGLVYGIVWALVPAFSEADEDEATVTDIVFFVPYIPVLLYFIFCGLVEVDSSTLDGRFFSTGPDSYAFFRLYCAQTLWHCVLVMYKKATNSHKAVLLVHHTLSIACYLPAALGDDKFHYWGLLDSVCEVTNLFLNTVVLLKFKAMGVQEVSFVHAANGALLFVSWIVFRLVVFPFWLWSMYHDL